MPIPTLATIDIANSPLLPMTYFHVHLLLFLCFCCFGGTTLVFLESLLYHIQEWMSEQHLLRSILVNPIKSIQRGGYDLQLFPQVTSSLPHYITTSLDHQITSSLHHYVTTSLRHYITSSLYYYITISLITISLQVFSCVQGDVEASGEDQDYITGAETVNGDQEVRTQSCKQHVLLLVYYLNDLIRFSNR